MQPPAGTFLATTTDDRVQLPPAIVAFLRESQWTEVLVTSSAADEVITIYPIPYLGVSVETGFTSEMTADGVIAIGDQNRRTVGLNGQGVMVRVESDILRIYLRRVFQTLGFRPA